MATISIDEFARKTGASLDEAARAIKLEVFGGIIDDTRVDTGRLKGNWQTTTGSPALGVGLLRKDKDGDVAKLEAATNITGDGIDFMVNNLVYATVWEERDAMVARNIARVSSIVRKHSK